MTWDALSSKMDLLMSAFGPSAPQSLFFLPSTEAKLFLSSEWAAKADRDEASNYLGLYRGIKVYEDQKLGSPQLNRKHSTYVATIG